MYDIPNPNRLRIQKSEKEGFTESFRRPKLAASLSRGCNHILNAK